MWDSGAEGDQIERLRRDVLIPYLNILGERTLTSAKSILAQAEVQAQNKRLPRSEQYPISLRVVHGEAVYDVTL